MNISWPGYVRRTGANEILQDIGLFFLFLAIFAGRFSLDRLLKTQIGRWGSIELWATAGALGIAYLLIRRGWVRLSFSDRRTKLFVGTILILYLILTINLVLMGNQAIKMRGLLDHLFLVVHVLLIILFISSPYSLRRMCRIIVTISVFLGALWIIGTIIGYDSKFMRVLLYSKLSIYRLEFFGFTCALYAVFYDQTPSWGKYYLVSAVFLLCAVLISVALAAVLAVFLAVMWMLLWQLSCKQYRLAICLIIISCLSSGFFFVSKANFYAGYFSSRITATVDGSKEWVTGRDERIISMVKSLRENPSPDFNDLSREDQQILEAYAWLHNYRIPQHGEGLARYLWGLSHQIIIFDGSDRLDFALVALRDWSRNKLFGQGMGNYRTCNVILGTTNIQTYHYPHNIFLEMLAGAGIIGFGAFCLALFLVFVLVQQACLSFFPNTAFLGAMAFYLLSACFSGDYYDFRLFWFVSLFALCTRQESES